MYARLILSATDAFHFTDCVSSLNQSKTGGEISHSDYYTQSSSNRMTAEWEPAAGTLITWPLCISYKLAVELAKDNKLFTRVEDESARSYLWRVPKQ